jgi:tetratricopeptide (TPR) repeat protein
MTPELENLLEQASAAFAAKEYRQAVMLLRKVVAAEPTNVKALTKMGTAFYKLREYDEAAEHLKKAIVVEPKDRDLWFALGLVCIKKGDRPAALQTYDKLKKIHVDKADELYKLIYS